MRSIRSTLLASLLVGAAAPALAYDVSTPSAMSADASATVIAGSMMSVAAAGTAVVASAQLVGDGIVLVLDAGGQASAATIRVSAKAAHGLSLAAGTTLQVVAVSTGQMLVLSGKVLAFIPNQVGSALLHHARVS